MIMVKTLSFAVLSLIMSFSVQSFGQDTVRLIKSSADSFVFKTGDYSVCYSKGKNGQAWVKIVRGTDCNGPAIATKFANGQSLDVTDFAAGEGYIYNWADVRKDSKMFRSLSCSETADAVTINIKTSRMWADFNSTFIAYKKYPGLIHWKVAASTKTDRAFGGVSSPDCYFMTNNAATEWDQLITHQVARYMTQRGPESGIVYFRDVPMNSYVFYFEDFSSLNDLYRLTGCENPYDYPIPGNPGAVKLGQAETDFQMSSSDGNNIKKPIAWKEKIESYDRFGYYRPSVRIPAGKRLVLADTYLYLRPAGEVNNIETCRNFVEMLSHVYRYIYKPPLVKTDWAGQVAPNMIKDILRPENLSIDKDGIIVPRAYVGYEHEDLQLWTVVNLLHPLELYVKKFPNDAAARRLRDGLNNAMPMFYDKEWKGFTNGPAPLPTSTFFTIVYLVEPGVMVSDLALLGNANAKMMLTGFRDRLLDMGKKCDYVFADVWLKDFSKQDNWYQMDGTGAYAYMLMALYELSGGTDKECLAGAEAAAEKIKDRCLEYSWEINQSAAGIIACEKIYQATKDPHYRDILYIPLANTLRHAWLWECDYGVGEFNTTFWAFSGCPAAPSSAEYEDHRCRFHFRQYMDLVGTAISPELKTMLTDAWKIGMTQSRSTIAPLVIKDGGGKFICNEGKSQTNCGQIHYDQWVPFEDVRAGWGTDSEWWHNNTKLGVVGQEIYGAGGPIWYALWQSEL
jgi:hypothetical protein